MTLCGREAAVPVSVRATVFLAIAVFVFICCVLAGTIARRKNRSFFVFFLLALFGAGIFGVVEAFMVPAGAPKGMRRVHCPKCSTPQNIPKAEQSSEVECEWCGFEGNPSTWRPVESFREWFNRTHPGDFGA